MNTVLWGKQEPQVVALNSHKYEMRSQAILTMNERCLIGYDWWTMIHWLRFMNYDSWMMIHGSLINYSLIMT